MFVCIILKSLGKDVFLIMERIAKVRSKVQYLESHGDDGVLVALSLDFLHITGTFVPSCNHGIIATSVNGI